MSGQNNTIMSLPVLSRRFQAGRSQSRFWAQEVTSGPASVAADFRGAAQERTKSRVGSVGCQSRNFFLLKDDFS